MGDFVTGMVSALGGALVGAKANNLGDANPDLKVTPRKLITAAYKVLAEQYTNKFTPTSTSLNVIDNNSVLESLSKNKKFEDKDLPFLDKFKDHPELNKIKVELREQFVLFLDTATSNYAEHLLAKDVYRQILQKYLDNGDNASEMRDFVTEINNPSSLLYLSDVDAENLHVFRSDMGPFKFLSNWAKSYSDISAAVEMALSASALAKGENNIKAIFTNYQNPLDMEFSMKSLLSFASTQNSEEFLAALSTFDPRNLTFMMTGDSGRVPMGELFNEGPVGLMMQGDIAEAFKDFRQESFLFLKRYDNNEEIPIRRSDKNELWKARDYAEEVMEVSDKDGISYNHLINYYMHKSTKIKFGQRNAGIGDSNAGGILALNEMLQMAHKIGVNHYESVFYKSDGKTPRELDTIAFNPEKGVKQRNAFWTKMPSLVEMRNFFYMRFAATAISKVRNAGTLDGEESVEINHEKMFDEMCRHAQLPSAGDFKVIADIAKDQKKHDPEYQQSFYAIPDPIIVKEEEVNKRIKKTETGASMSISDALKPNEVFDYNPRNIITIQEKSAKAAQEDRANAQKIASIMSKTPSVALRAANVLGNIAKKIAGNDPKSPLGKLQNTLQGAIDNERRENQKKKQLERDLQEEIKNSPPLKKPTRPDAPDKPVFDKDESQASKEAKRDRYEKDIEQYWEDEEKYLKDKEQYDRLNPSPQDKLLKLLDKGFDKLKIGTLKTFNFVLEHKYSLGIAAAVVGGLAAAPAAIATPLLAVAGLGAAAVATLAGGYYGAKYFSKWTDGNLVSKAVGATVGMGLTIGTITKSYDAIQPPVSELNNDAAINWTNRNLGASDQLYAVLQKDTVVKLNPEKYKFYQNGEELSTIVLINNKPFTIEKESEIFIPKGSIMHVRNGAENLLFIGAEGKEMKIENDLHFSLNPLKAIDLVLSPFSPDVKVPADPKIHVKNNPNEPWTMVDNEFYTKPTLEQNKSVSH